MAQHCPECGFANDDGASYCQRCGSFLAQSEQSPGLSTATYKVGETALFRVEGLEDGAATYRLSEDGVKTIRIGHISNLRGDAQECFHPPTETSVLGI